MVPETGKSSLDGDTDHDGGPYRARFLRLSPTICWISFLLAAGINLTYFLFSRSGDPHTNPPPARTWYSHIVSPTGICENEPFGDGRHPKMHAGYIGLEGDTIVTPRRSFFWLFEAEQNPQDAPLVLVTAGGPGTSALVHAIFGQSACSLETSLELSFNKWRWTEKLNVLFLDHPIGTGYSFGTMANNSHSAALDVYDFLQKFYVLFPAYTRSKLVLSSGSYGGIFMPHIASVIHERNKQPQDLNTTKILLDSVMLTNPVLNVDSHFRWLLRYRCVEKEVYDKDTCKRLYDLLPHCLENIELAFLRPTVEHKLAAIDFCQANIASADTNGTLLEDVRKKCYAKPTPTNPGVCHPHFMVMDQFFDSPSTKTLLGVPQKLGYRSLAVPVNQAFHNTGDMMAEHHLLLEPLLADGVRLLIYAGAQDANCAWPGVLSSLELLRTPFQADFIKAEDKPWAPWDSDIPAATIRSAGDGAGNLTYILINDAGHFVIKDNPSIAKLIAERWIFNKPFFD